MDLRNEVALRFAAALDTEDYAVVRTCLVDDCVYESPRGELIGPDAIVESYRANGDSARQRFDSIVYRHEIEPLGEGWFKIEFIDELHARGRSHVFRCNQRVQIGKGQIVRIDHEEIPGQREQLNLFCAIWPESNFNIRRLWP